METPEEFCKRKGFTQQAPGTTSYYIMWSMIRQYAKYYHEQQVKSEGSGDVGRSEQLHCEHKRARTGHHLDQPSWCLDCGEEL